MNVIHILMVSLKITNAVKIQVFGIDEYQKVWGSGATCAFRGFFNIYLKGIVN